MPISSLRGGHSPDGPGFLLCRPNVLHDLRPGRILCAVRRDQQSVGLSIADNSQPLASLDTVQEVASLFVQHLAHHIGLVQRWFLRLACHPYLSPLAGKFGGH